MCALGSMCVCVILQRVKGLMVESLVCWDLEFRVLMFLWGGCD